MHQVHFNFEGLLLPEIHDYNQMLPTSLSTAAEVFSYQKQPKPKVSNSHESWGLYLGFNLNQTKSRNFSTFPVNQMEYFN